MAGDRLDFDRIFTYRGAGLGFTPRNFPSRLSKILNIMLLAVLLQGCSVFDLANLAAPDEGFRVERGIAYGELPRQKMDVYRPDNHRDRGATLVFFYGGGWRDGSRDKYRFVGSRLASEGYTVVIPDYRLYPEVVFPRFVEDGAMAVASVKGEIGRALGLPDTLLLSGHSAGAHIAMLLALDPRYLDAAGLSTSNIDGVVGLAGPYDFLPLSSQRLKRIFPGAVAEHDSQPIHFVSAAAPPALLAHGDSDSRVWIHNSKNLHAALENAGVDSRLHIYPGVGHGGILRPLVGIIEPNSSLLTDLADFVSSVSQPTGTASTRDPQYFTLQP